MKSIEELLKNLARPEVVEFGLVTNRLPSVNIGGKFEPVDDEAPTTEAVLRMLVVMGGSRHVDSLTDKPAQWTTRLDGVGVISVAAIVRQDVVQARFTVARRDPVRSQPKAEPLTPSVEAPKPAPVKVETPKPAPAKAEPTPFDISKLPPMRPPMPTQDGPPPARTESDAATAARLAARANASIMQTQPGTGEPVVLARTKATEPSAAPLTPIAVESREPEVVEVSFVDIPLEELDALDDDGSEATTDPPPPHYNTVPVPPMPDAPADAMPAADEWEEDDDDEPTLQTAAPPVSPPVSPSLLPAAPTHPPAPLASVPSAPSSDPKPKPARKAAPSASDIEQPPSAVRAVSAPVPRVDVEPGDGDGADVEITQSLKGSPPPEGVESSGVRSPAEIPENDRPRGDGPLDSFLALAVGAGASDLHIVSGRPLLLRLGGDLVPRTRTITTEHVERLTRDLVPAAARGQLDLEGCCQFALERAPHGRFRVHVSKHRGGFKITMRIVPREVPSLAALGLPEALASLARLHRGLVLVTGPVGHGKTTTVASLVDVLNRESARHILTIEDPIEFVHSGKRSIVTQREVSTHARSRAAALAASLHEDVDVLALGEISDLASARHAIAAADNGTLVLATVTCLDAGAAVDRIVDYFPVEERAEARARLAGTLRLVVGQRLVPGIERTRMHVAIEVLPSSMALYQLVRSGETARIASLESRGRSAFVPKLEESLTELVRAKKVSLEAARAFAILPDESPEAASGLERMG
ncbi:Twitching motility protein PilT [Labilithrix luteola]|uniref:Twitching motility protein PilT n=1 Tax=Labilithrix luteola TaxID=1391654 RepID=A0A0K1QB58_9BACT|nr:ATPase, T2SS/T4P/T4SS family [Labilithrix luteola]AKV02968.1 Twitching motility protein PilT [Labilithrix luteola]